MVRPYRSFLLTSVVLLAVSACAEQPRCVGEQVRRFGETVEDVTVQCSAGKVAICGDDSAQLYDPVSGALLPTPAAPDDLYRPEVRQAFTGSCDGADNCRDRPVCRGSAGEAPTCANGLTPGCRLGRVDEIEPPLPMVDAGSPPPTDGGSGSDAGGEDAGGGVDAGTVDAGAVDAGAVDAGP